MRLNNSRIQKISVAGVSVLLVGTVFMAPSYGLSITNLINNWKNINNYISTYKKVQQAWNLAGEKSKKAQQATDDCQGDMGDCDPTVASDDYENELVSDPDYSIFDADQDSQDLEREIIRANAANITSKDGQTYRAQQIDSSLQTANDAEYLAQQAQQMDASQNILKVIAAQNGQIVSMLAQQRSDSLQARPDTAYSTLILTQVGKQLSTQRKEKDLEQQGTLALLHEVVLNARLDPTTSIDE